MSVSVTPARAEEIARDLIYSIADDGLHPQTEFPSKLMPTRPLLEVAELVKAGLEEGVKGWQDIVAAKFTDAPDRLRILFVECCKEGLPPRPEHRKPLIDSLRKYHATSRRLELIEIAKAEASSGNSLSAILAELTSLECEGAEKTSLLLHGVNHYPTEVPPETVLLGNGWGRWGDVLTFISTAGAGKSVALTQASIAWGIGLPYMGIHPARPLRILLFSGEDDGATIGQCREGFLEHSKAITGHDLTAEDLEPLDSMLRIEFSRVHVGDAFHAHLDRLLRESPADLVMVNPLLSYIGGEIVACASQWLRAGLMPILQKHSCAAMLAHHTGKMGKDGWDNTDDTYSAIGGGEMANVPRAILTLRPTAADGLSVLKVAKRPTTGWKDSAGDFTTSFFVRRTSDPTRPAWLPVDSDEAGELLDASKVSQRGGKSAKKVTAAHVVAPLKVGAMQRQALIERLMVDCICSERSAVSGIKDAESEGEISSFSEPNPRGGNPLKWLCLPEHLTQYAK